MHPHPLLLLGLYQRHTSWTAPASTRSVIGIKVGEDEAILVLCCAR